MKNFIFLMVIVFIPTLIFAEIDANKSYELGITAYENGNIEKAQKLLKQAIEAGIYGEKKKDAKNKIATIPFVLHDAAYNGDLKRIKLLINNGYEIDRLSKRTGKPTALLIASAHGHMEVVEFLLNNGANPNYHDSDNSTPLACAVTNGHVNVINILIRNGASINLKATNGSTALTYATFYGKVDIVKLLLNNGADIFIKDNDGHGPLWFALGKEKISSIFVDFMKKDKNTDKELVNEFNNFKFFLNKGDVKAAYNCLSQQCRNDIEYDEFEKGYSSLKKQFNKVEGLYEEKSKSDRGFLYLYRIKDKSPIMHSPLKFIFEDGKWKIKDI